MHKRTPSKEGNENMNLVIYQEERLGFIWTYDNSYNYLSINNFNFRCILYFSCNLQIGGVKFK